MTADGLCVLLGLLGLVLSVTVSSPLVAAIPVTNGLNTQSFFMIYVDVGEV